MCQYCEAARKCIKGDYGNGSERKEKLEKEGYCPKCVQTLVNSFLGKPYKISHDDCGHCLQGYCKEAIKILSD